MAEIKEEQPDIFERHYPVDMEIGVSEASLQLAEQLEMLAPFGNRNPKPLFRLKNVRISEVRYMGDEGQHVRFKISSGGEMRQTLSCVLFGKAKDYEEILNRKGFAKEIIGSLDCQVWQSVKRLQFMTEFME